jgi:hypothetical protein
LPAGYRAIVIPWLREAALFGGFFRAYQSLSSISFEKAIEMRWDVLRRTLDDSIH